MKGLFNRHTLLAAILVAALALAMYAQAPKASPAAASSITAPASFEVASIRMVDQHTTDGNLSMSTYPTARFFMHNTTLDFLIVQAYGIELDYIQNDHDWMDSQLYDVDATVEGGKPLTFEEIHIPLQNLLQQRFHLTAHRTTKLVSGYELVLFKSGAQLQSAKGHRTPGGPVLSNRMSLWNIDMAHFAGILSSRPVGQPVLDKTGLTGSYDINLSYAPLNDPVANSNQPDFFTAIQEQLGLKLIPAKVPVDYLVIDHVDRVPTEN